ncbi:unnamed protein product [Diatraea saccharalis]|uniref:Uncharacterized protein n=1 Tax=Diatraea saccharalis TaxID=40085 RepID=A0A9N9WF38_9NEOP|nr:unnamed protein product [Diatraea saccharalis]
MVALLAALLCTAQHWCFVQSTSSVECRLSLILSTKQAEVLAVTITLLRNRLALEPDVELGEMRAQNERLEKQIAEASSTLAPSEGPTDVDDGDDKRITEDKSTPLAIQDQEQQPSTSTCNASDGDYRLAALDKIDDAVGQSTSGEENILAALDTIDFNDTIVDNKLANVQEVLKKNGYQVHG